MAVEIERKFLVALGRAPLEGVTPKRIVQGYLASDPVAMRVRIADTSAFLTLKSTGEGISRQEYEYPIPLIDAHELLAQPAILGVLSKLRYEVIVDGVLFEVDVYEGALEGLVTAEVELASEGASIPSPSWLGSEVSSRRDFSNDYLSRFGLPHDFNVLCSPD